MRRYIIGVRTTKVVQDTVRVVAKDEQEARAAAAAVMHAKHDDDQVISVEAFEVLATDADWVPV